MSKRQSPKLYKLQILGIYKNGKGWYNILMSNTYKNTAFWSWNADIEKEEALWQLSDFKDKGYGGAFIHARGGLEIEYMGKEWFEVFDACVEWAAKNDFDIWLYDEFGWPSGFGGGKVNGLGEGYQIKHLVDSDKIIEDERHKLFNTYMVGEKQRYIHLYTDKNYVDLLNPKVTKAFIESTHEVYYVRYKKYFGNVIKGIFTDEPQVFVFHPYSEQIVQAFQEKHGVDFHENMWKLFVDCPEREEFFYQYYSIIAELLTENFTKPIAKWCEEHGIMFTGHFAEEDGLMRQYRATGGVMRNYEPMQQPSIDFLGRRLTSPVLPKQLCSIKNQFEKPTVLSETLGCAGWNVSFAQIAWIWGYQVAFGVNKACLHLSAYTIRGTRKRDYPAFYSYQEPWWECFGGLSAEMESINAFVSQGKQKNDILLISALTSTYSQQYRADRGKTVSAQFRQTVENLISKQYSFDIGDERIMRDFANVSDGKLKIGVGEYGYILIPEAINLEKETWELLKAAQKTGVKIAFINAKPEKCSGKDVSEEYQVILECPVVANRAGLIEKYFRSIGYQRKVKIIDVCDGQVCDELVVNVAEDEKEIRIFAQNTACGKWVDGRLFVSEYGQFYDEEKLDTAVGQKGVYTSVKIPPMGHIAIRLLKGATPVCGKKKFVSAQTLSFHSAKLTADNSLNIDKAYFVIDGEKSPLIDTVLLQDEINRAVNQKGLGKTAVAVVYTFAQKDILDRLQIAVETRGVEKIVYNGKQIDERFDGWYIDKGIRLADVTDLQKTGENVLVVSYLVWGQRAYSDTLDGFETERNLFHYKSEAESVYLVGDFSVENKNPVFDDGYLTTSLDGFTVAKPQKIDFEKELTTQGLYFYRGGVEYRYMLIKQAEEKIFLRFEDFNGVTAKITANGKEKAVINPWDKTNITELLTDGENELVITLYGSNRNLLGPFHHQSGESALVGNSTFRGKKGFEDTVLYNHFGENTYDERYHFVKLGLGLAIAEKYKGE